MPAAHHLNSRPELLRQWIAEGSGNDGALLLNAQQVRMLALDALTAHEFRTALFELVFCKNLKDRLATLPEGDERTRVMMEYSQRVGAAWTVAFSTLGIAREAA